MHFKSLQFSHSYNSLYNVLVMLTSRRLISSTIDNRQ